MKCGMIGRRAVMQSRWWQVGIASCWIVEILRRSLMSRDVGELGRLIRHLLSPWLIRVELRILVAVGKVGWPLIVSVAIPLAGSRPRLHFIVSQLPTAAFTIHWQCVNQLLLVKKVSVGGISALEMKPTSSQCSAGLTLRRQWNPGG